MPMHRCEFVRDDGEDCGARSVYAVSVRARLSDRWQFWPVCSAHVDLIAADIGSMLLVSGSYVIGDRTGRRSAEHEADLVELEREVADS